jgi:hypothetical protein
VSAAAAGKIARPASLQYLAALVDWRSVIVKGEAGVVLVAANNVAQARIAYNYISAVFDEAPALRGFVTRRTSDTI